MKCLCYLVVDEILCANRFETTKKQINSVVAY